MHIQYAFQHKDFDQVYQVISVHKDSCIFRITPECFYECFDK